MMDEYYYLDANNQQKGPVKKEELSGYGVTKSTLVWKQGMRDWQQAGTLGELSYLLPDGAPRSATATPPPFIPSASSYQAASAPTQPKPDNYLVWAILTTVLCCLPCGIVAIIYSTKVNSAWDAGDYTGAQEAAKSAKTWSIVSAALGFVAFILAFFGGLMQAIMSV